VKFIRWAQWRIERTGAGILGFITNHSYLDNPTFRGMRQCLTRAFDELYVLDLHGNTKKKERCPDGSRDENVFDIQQGVAILLAVKHPINERSPARVFHAHLWGLRQAKENGLMEQDLAATRWAELSPKPPSYFFVPHEADLEVEYEAGVPLTDLMPTWALGFQTHRDPVAVALDLDSLKSAVRRYLGGALPEVAWLGLCRPSAYRPFDTRFVCLHPAVADRPRMVVNRHMLEPNVALNVVRQTKWPVWQHAYVSSKPSAALLVEVKDGASVFPLCLYAHAAPDATPEVPRYVGPLPASVPLGRAANLNPAQMSALAAGLGLAFQPDGPGDLRRTLGAEDVFHYIYAVLHSPTYRRRYAEFLKRDFPRIPLTSNRDLFAALCRLGADLVALHLVEPDYPAASWTREGKPSPFAQPITTYPVRGSDVVERGYPKYLAPGEPEPGTGQPLGKGRVYINKTQHFEGVPDEVWEFHIGGYQVCEKWLKDRRGRKLSLEDKEHYRKIVVALKETIRLMGEIDTAIPEWPIR
jgi:hypothetical protein